MKRLVVVLTLAASPLLAAAAEACAFDQCPGSKQVCRLGVVECRSSLLDTVCANTDVCVPIR